MFHLLLALLERNQEPLREMLPQPALLLVYRGTFMKS